VGEPPDVEIELAAIKEQVREKLNQVPVQKIVTGLVTLLVVGMALYLLFGPSEKLEGPAQAAGQALADNDLASLKSIAASGTADDVARWFAEVHARLADSRENWTGKEEAVEVGIGPGDPAKRKGSAVIKIHPVFGLGLDTSLADPAAATASAAAPFEVETAWTLNRWGHWKLDGRETYALAHPKQ
jgi:hypothetical protein